MDRGLLLIVLTSRRTLVGALVVAAVAVVVVALSTTRDSPPDAPARHVRPFTVAWVGDMSLSTELGLPPLAEAGPLGAVRRHLRSDLSLGNLEGTLGSGGGSKCGRTSTDCHAFRAPSRYARMYASAGFDVLNVANNHAFDYGEEGQRRTLSALDRANLGHVGRPGQILIRRVGGARVALLGFAPYPWANTLDIPAAEALVRRASRGVDVVVVMIHAGAEGADRTRTPRGTETAFGENRGDARAFAHAVVDAGADLVLGSGPHVLRGIERYRERVIAYSLGNFLGYHTFGQGGALSLSGILRVRIDGSGRARAGRWVSIRLTGAGTPELDPGDASARLVTTLSRDDFGKRGVAIDGHGRLRWQRLPTAERPAR